MKESRTHAHTQYTHTHSHAHAHTSYPAGSALGLSAGCDPQLRLRTEPRSALTLRTHDWTCKDGAVWLVSGDVCVRKVLVEGVVKCRTAQLPSPLLIQIYNSFTKWRYLCDTVCTTEYFGLTWWSPELSSIVLPVQKPVDKHCGFTTRSPTVMTYLIETF